MDERDPEKSLNSGDRFAEKVGAAARHKLNAERSVRRSVWSGLGAIGLIGWSVVVPALLGAALGTWLDEHHPGRHAWTLALMIGGLSLGCLNAWRWVTHEDKSMHGDD